MSEALVVPGVLSIAPRIWEGEGRAEVLRHRLAGIAELPELSDWKQTVWCIPHAAAQRLGLPLPEHRLQPAPRLAARFAAARLVQVEEDVALRAIKAGEQALFLAYHRVGGGGGMEWHSGGGVQGFSCEDGPLFDAAFGTGEEEEDGEYHDTALLYDRILTTLSEGSLSLYDVDLAMLACCLLEEDLPSWEAELAWVEAQGLQRRAEAEEVLLLLAQATTDRVQLPEGRVAIRQREPAFALTATRDLQLTGHPIEVPATERWWVEQVRAFEPPSRLERRAEALARLRRSSPAGHSAARWLGALVLLVALGMLWQWLR
ncbi:MAG TPA: hypothetical protein PLA94_12080 [Myxococcota bacterium]|nr:hypothetical protein [Myxococcota bacterium]